MQNILFERLVTLVGVDKVLFREVTGGIVPGAAFAYCRRRLEDEQDKENNPLWPTIGCVRLVDHCGEELACYSHLTLMADRSAEYRDTRRLELSFVGGVGGRIAAPIC